MTKTAVAALLSLLAFPSGCADGGDSQNGSRPWDQGGDRKKGTDPKFTENDPGDLVVTWPPRASFFKETSDGLMTVTGSGATKALHVNGQPVDPALDGSFTTSITAAEGLNLVRVVDGKNAIDVPFLYGRYLPASDPIPRALAVRLNPKAFDNPDPSVVSLALLGRKAIADIDVLAALDNSSLSGTLLGADWTFDVSATSYTGVDLGLGPLSGGASFEARVKNIEVDGILSVKVLGVGPSGPVQITSDAAHVFGGIDVGFDATTGTIDAHVVSPTTELENFQYHSNNAGGFPCCVDSIMSKILKPYVEADAQEQVNAQLSKNFAFALSQLSLPPSIDLNGVGLPATVAIDDVLDGVTFDDGGGLLTAAVHFHHDIGPSDIGATAPGWLTVSEEPGSMVGSSSFGISAALDALNQALFAAWAQNGLERSIDGVPLVGSIKVSPKLPPVVLPDGAGGLTASAGEIVVEAQIGNDHVEAAVTIVDGIVAAIDAAGGGVSLTPSPTPLISVTWIASEGLTEALRQALETKIVDMLPTLLTPIQLPLPTLPLGNIASGFGSSVGAVSAGSALSVDASSGRIVVSGDFAIVP